MLVLGIETSCDETGIAVYCTNQGLLAHVLYSQVDLHAQYGGVVPELASRDHIRKMIPLTQEVLNKAKVTQEQLDAIAYTAGPGLMGALLVGATFARTMAWSLGIRALAVHHMEAHLLAPLMDVAAHSQNKSTQTTTQQVPKLPFVALLVSGGHTQLVKVNEMGDYKLLGESLDDAAGEAFDKAAKMLGLGYPGGPAIAKTALRGTPERFKFPRPMTDRPGLDFSFSGLKTYTLNTIEKLKAEQGHLSEQDTADIALAFEQAVVDTLFIKCRRAVEQTSVEALVMAGGVSANLELRKRLENNLDAQVIYAPMELCTDNGAMIAYAGAQRLLQGEQTELAINTRPRWPLTELAPAHSTTPP